MNKRIIIDFKVDEKDDVQDFLGKLADRVISDAVFKAWKKVVNKGVEAELAARGIALAEPSVTFQVNGETTRVATTEDDGYDTDVDSEDESCEDLKDEVAEAFRKEGLKVAPDGTVSR